MRNRVMLLSLALMLASPLARAGEAADALSSCLAEAVTPDDRRALARWIFGVLAEHPDVSDLAAVDRDARDALEAASAAVFERLIARDCTAQSRQVLVQEGSAAFGKAFETVGEIAMGSVLEHPRVQGAMEGLGEHVDPDRMLRALLAP